MSSELHGAPAGAAQAAAACVLTCTCLYGAVQCPANCSVTLAKHCRPATTCVSTSPSHPAPSLLPTTCLRSQHVVAGAVQRRAALQECSHVGAHLRRTRRGGGSTRGWGVCVCGWGGVGWGRGSGVGALQQKARRACKNDACCSGGAEGVACARGKAGSLQVKRALLLAGQGMSRARPPPSSIHPSVQHPCSSTGVRRRRAAPACGAPPPTNLFKLCCQLIMPLASIREEALFCRRGGGGGGDNDWSKTTAVGTQLAVRRSAQR